MVLDTDRTKPISAMFVFSCIMGVAICAILPPLGFVMICGGIWLQGGIRGRHNRAVRKLAAQLRAERLATERRTTILAWKSLP